MANSIPVLSDLPELSSAREKQSKSKQTINVAISKNHQCFHSRKIEQKSNATFTQDSFGQNQVSKMIDLETMKSGVFFVGSSGQKNHHCFNRHYSQKHVWKNNSISRNNFIKFSNYVKDNILGTQEENCLQKLGKKRNRSKKIGFLIAQA